MNLFMCNIADMDGIFFIQGNGNDGFTIEAFIDDAAADGIAIKANQQIKERGPVSDADILFAYDCTEDLFRKIKGVMIALNVGKVWIRFQFFHGDLVPIMEGMGVGNEDMGGGRKELMEDEVVGLEELFQDGTIEVVHIKDADFTFHIRCITDNFIGLGFLEAKIIGVAAIFLDQVYKGIDCEGVVLS